MGNMKQLNNFLEEVKKEKMSSAITLARTCLDEGKSLLAEQTLQDTLKNLDALRDKVTTFISANDDTPVLEPYHGELKFTYKGESFTITLSKTFNGQSSDIMHLWYTSDDLLEHIDWLCGSEELEKLVDKHLKSNNQRISSIPIEFYIWSELKPWLDKYLANK